MDYSIKILIKQDIVLSYNGINIRGPVVQLVAHPVLMKCKIPATPIDFISWLLLLRL